MYIYPIKPDEIFHYGMPRRSGRYPWGSGDRPYQSVNFSALSLYKRASEKEKIITKDIKEAVKNSDSKLYGLENRLKTPDSIQRKMNKIQIEEDKSEKESMGEIHDLVRYTTISDTKDFVSNYEIFKKNMTNLGYTEIKCKNYFDLFNQGLVKHKAVQSQFSTKDGYVFEVQFQTPESQDAKEKKVPLYEERRKVNIDQRRAKELENEMEKLALKVPDPPGIEKIKTHSSYSIKHSQESEVKFKMNDFYYLSHGGPGSGRYPWGSGDRPYQRLEKAKRRHGIGEYIRSRRAKKAEEQMQKDMAEARKRAAAEEERKRKFAEEKEKILRSGSAADIMRYQGHWTNDELKEAYNRIDWEKKLSSFATADVKTNMKKIDEAMNNLQTANKWGGILIDSYNILSSVYNISEQGQKNPKKNINKPQISIPQQQGDGGGKKKK